MTTPTPEFEAATSSGVDGALHSRIAQLEAALAISRHENRLLRQMLSTGECSDEALHRHAEASQPAVSGMILPSHLSPAANPVQVNQVLQQTLAALTSDLDIERILHQILLAIDASVDTFAVALWLYVPAERHYQLKYTCRAGVIEPELMLAAGRSLKTELPADRQSATQRRVPLFATDSFADLTAESQAWLAYYDIHGLLSLPLCVGTQTIGAIGLITYQATPCTSDQIDLVQALAHQAALALHLAQLAEQAKNAALLAERNRLAREIHDSLAQHLTAILMQSQSAQDLLLDQPDIADQHLLQIRELARRGIVEARRTMQALRPHDLEERDLATALRRNLALVEVGASVQTSLTLQGDPVPIPPDVEVQLLRIAQEALSNALKYSQARQITITLRFIPAQVQLLVSDNGCGFDMSLAEASGGFGLCSIHERAATIGATVQLITAPGAGTTIDVCVPLTKE